LPQERDSRPRRQSARESTQERSSAHDALVTFNDTVNKELEQVRSVFGNMDVANTREIESVSRNISARSTPRTDDGLAGNKSGSANRHRFEDFQTDMQSASSEGNLMPELPFRIPDIKEKPESLREASMMALDTINEEKKRVQNTFAMLYGANMLGASSAVKDTAARTTEPRAADVAKSNKKSGSANQRQFDKFRADKPAESSAVNKPPEKPSAPAEAPSKPAPESSAEPQSNKQNKLKFSEGETTPSKGSVPNNKQSKVYEKAKYKSERSEQRLESARDKLPGKKKLKVERTYVEGANGKGKAKNRLVFDKEIRSQHEHLKGAPITRPFKAGGRTATRFVHSKVFQAEHENVALKAAHRGEMVAEAGLRSAYRMHKTAPYRKVARLERKTAKLNMNTSYQKALRDNPKLRSNVFSRMAQKRKIRKQYAKAMRDAKKTGATMKRSGNVIGNAGRAISRMISRNPKLFAIIAILFLLVIIISSLISACASMGSSTSGAVTALSYLSQDADIDNAELAYTEWETDLKLELMGIEATNPGYDEYRYFIEGITSLAMSSDDLVDEYDNPLPNIELPISRLIDSIWHNPLQLVAFLTAVYYDFTFGEVEGVLLEIFEEQYELILEPVVEIRYQEVQSTDPITGEETWVEEPYNWNVLNVTLVSRSFTGRVSNRMDEEQQMHYNLLLMSRGSRQYSGSPFDFNWQYSITSYYGYRVHPTTGEKDNHRGIDIAVPIGTDVYAGHDGTVTFAGYNGDYGYVVVLDDGKGLVTKYAHCDSLLVIEGQTVTVGTVIAKSGDSGLSTGAHLHFEVLKDGMYLNPIYFALMQPQF